MSALQRLFRWSTACCSILLAGAMTSAGAGAATVNLIAVDKNGGLMPDVVMSATLLGAAPSSESSGTPEAVTIAQDHRQFTPYVTAIRVGTPVRFPNYDRIEHHVKSFSPAKEFEIKIYESGTPPPVLFDKPGIVVVYCLLHEWMRAYVMVLDTPFFSKTDSSGAASLNGLKEGTWQIKAWHPDMGSVKPSLVQTVKVVDKPGAPVKFVFDFVPRARKAAK